MQLNKDDYLIPVLAYLVGIVWLLAINIVNVARGLGFEIGPGEDYFYVLSQFDAIVHYMVALSLAVVGRTVLGPRRTVVILLVVILLWEVFEVMTMDAFTRLPGITTTGAYYADTLKDLALGVAGVLTGAFLGGKASNTTETINGGNHGR